MKWIETLWTFFGVLNQMFAGMALLAVIIILFKMGKAHQAWVAIAHAILVLISTLYAGILKLFLANGDRVHDFISHVAFVSDQYPKSNGCFTKSRTSKRSLNRCSRGEKVPQKPLSKGKRF